MKQILLLINCLLCTITVCSQSVDIKLPSGSTLHLYPSEKATGITVMMCPGGGYDHLAINHEGHDMARWFNSQGVTYAVLQYRLPDVPCDTLPMTDAHEALHYLSDNADEIAINRQKIGIMGASAGGHLASHIANTDTLVAFQVLLYPVISMCDEIGHGGSRLNLLGKNPTSEIIERFSNEKLVQASTSQAFIVLSADDKDVMPLNSLRYFEALQRNGVPVEMHIFPDGGHGWGFRDSFPHKRQWLDALAQWIKNIK